MKHISKTNKYPIKNEQGLRLSFSKDSKLPISIWKMPDIHKSLEKRKLNNTILLSQQFRMALSKNYNVLKVWRNESWLDGGTDDTAAVVEYSTAVAQKQTKNKN